jgi:hypothetical protein
LEPPLPALEATGCGREGEQEGRERREEKRMLLWAWREGGEWERLERPTRRERGMERD